MSKLLSVSRAIFCGGLLAATMAGSALASIPNPTNPVAVPGPNVTVMADPYGLATVTLDGSASYATNFLGTILTYEWDTDNGLIYGEYPTVTLAGTGDHLVSLTVVDDYGLVSTAVQQTITVTPNPISAPVLLTEAQNTAVESDGLGNAAAFTAWITNSAGVVATTPNGPLTWTNNYNPANFVFNAPGSSTGSVIVLFTGTDPLGLQVQSAARFTVMDTILPTLTWSIGGVPAVAGGTYNISKKDVPLLISVGALDSAGPASVINSAATVTAGNATVVVNGGSFTISSAKQGAQITLTANAVDSNGNLSGSQSITIHIVAPGKAK